MQHHLRATRQGPCVRSRNLMPDSSLEAEEVVASSAAIVRSGGGRSS